MPMKRFAILGSLALLAVVGWTVGWFYVASEVETSVAALATADGVTTPRITCASLQVGGYPFRLDVTCTDVEVVAEDLSYGLPALDLHYGVFRPVTASLTATAPLTITDAFSGSRQRLDFSRLVAEVELAGWRIGHLSVDAGDLRLIGTLGGDQLIAAADSAGIDLLDIPEAHDPAAGRAALAAVAEVNGATAPGLDLDHGKTSIEAELTGLPDDIRRLTASEVVRSLKTGEAQLRLVRLAGSDARGSLESSGTLGFNAAAQPEGRLDIVSTGVVERLGQLVPQEWRLLVLGAEAADGSYRQTLSIRGGIVFSGLIPIATLPPLF